MMRRSIPGVAIFAVVTAIASIPRTARAADRHWNAASGVWAAATKWNPNGVPGPSDNAIIDFFAGGTAGSVAIGTTGTSAVTSVTVLNGGTVSMTDGRGGIGSLLCGTDFVLGKSGTGGTLNVIKNPNQVGAFPGGLTVADSLRLGVLSGSGVVNQNAGTVAIGNRLILGDSNQPASEFKGFGKYNLSGGTLRAPMIDVGLFTANGSTSGEFNVSGSATVNNVGTMHVLVGSVLNLSGSATVNTKDNSNVTVEGVVNQSGGNMNMTSFASDMYLDGTYNLSGGSLTLSFGLFGDAARLLPGARFNYTGGDAYIDFLILSADPGGTNGARVSLSSGGNKVFRTGVISVVDGTAIDLNDNAMTIDQSSGEFIRQKIARGYNGGPWNGDSITSTAARVNAQHNTALGYAPSGIGWKVKYTYFGDTDLNGVVNFDDYARIDSGFNNGGTDWFHGDFNYDGVVNFDDYALIDLAFNTQNGTLRQAQGFLSGDNSIERGMDEPGPQLVRQHLGQFGTSYARHFLATIPEPGFSMTAAVACIAIALPQRRKQRRNHVR